MSLIYSFPEVFNIIFIFRVLEIAAAPDAALPTYTNILRNIGKPKNSASESNPTSTGWPDVPEVVDLKRNSASGTESSLYCLSRSVGIGGKRCKSSCDWSIAGLKS